MKQTAVEILEEQFEKFLAWNIEGDPKAEKFTVDDMWIAFKLALELEKQQIIDAFKHAQVLNALGNNTRAEQFYFETYKNETE